MDSLHYDGVPWGRDGQGPGPPGPQQVTQGLQASVHTEALQGSFRLRNTAIYFNNILNIASSAGYIVLLTVSLYGLCNIQIHISECGKLEIYVGETGSACTG